MQCRRPHPTHLLKFSSLRAPAQLLSPTASKSAASHISAHGAPRRRPALACPCAAFPTPCASLPLLEKTASRPLVSATPATVPNVRDVRMHLDEPNEDASPSRGAPRAELHRDVRWLNLCQHPRPGSSHACTCVLGHCAGSKGSTKGACNCLYGPRRSGQGQRVHLYVRGWPAMVFVRSDVRCN